MTERYLYKCAEEEATVLSGCQLLLSNAAMRFFLKIGPVWYDDALKKRELNLCSFSLNAIIS